VKLVELKFEEWLKYNKTFLHVCIRFKRELKEQFFLKIATPEAKTKYKKGLKT
jgi:hypothetical protein